MIAISWHWLLPQFETIAPAWQNATTIVSYFLSMPCTVPSGPSIYLELSRAIDLVSLGILSWRSRVAGVGVGFVLSLSFNIASAFFSGSGRLRWPRYFLPLLVVMCWCWRFRVTEPAIQLSSQQPLLIQDELKKVA